MRVLVVDAQRLVRRGLCLMLDAESDLAVVGEAGTAGEASRLARDLVPDVILMDSRLPDIAGAEACRRLRGACPTAAMLLLTPSPDEDELAEALRCGAAGHVTKDASPSRMLRTLRGVAHGHVVLDPAVAMSMLSERGDSTRAAKNTPLSGREIEVLRLMAEGLRNREIAERLWISETTVKTHVSRVIRKLRQTDRTQAVLEALRQGLVRMPRTD